MNLPVDIVELLRDARSAVPAGAAVIKRLDAVLAEIDADQRTTKQRVLDLAGEYAAGRITQAQIARDLGVNVATVWNYMNLAGLSGLGRRLPPIAELVLRLREGESAKLIARAHGAALSTVYCALRREGFRLRRGRVTHDPSGLARGSEQERHDHIRVIERQVRELKEKRAAEFAKETADA